MNQIPNSLDSPDPTSLSDSVRAELRDLGFEQIGIARADEPPGVERFREWLDRGFAGSMDYLASTFARRADPSRVLPGVRSVIALGVLYPSASTAPPPLGSAEIASYARGLDYHRVLERRLRKARDRLAARFSGAFRYYVDTGPVLEKAWAQRAGLGWIGKNACLIDPERGSYFVLGVLLTTLALEPDDAGVDQCGSCRACLDACPTDAFPEPYVLDANRCISYLTIEQRDAIDEELESAMGALVFGCDICQQVCPYNEDGSHDFDLELGSRPENVAPSLRALVSLDESTFRERFPRSAVLRAKLVGFLRNVVIAISNRGTDDDLEILRALRERAEFRKSPVLRETLERACKRAEARG